MTSQNICIFGVPRSGTTWLAKVFDSHPATLLRHEPDTVTPNTDIPFIMPSAEIPRHLDAAAHYLELLTASSQLRCVSKTPYFPKDYRGLLAEKLRQGMITGLRGLDVLARGKLDRRARVPDLVSPGSAPISVVKSVDSCGRIPLFARARPDLRFVFIVRHPCGVLASKARGRKLGKMSSGAAFRQLLRYDSAQDFGLTLDQLEHWSTLEADAWAWTLAHDYIFKFTRDLANVRIVNYDKLCQEPLQEARKLFDWTGLSWNGQTEAYIQQCMDVNPDAGAAFYSTVQNPAQAANKWRSSLSTEDVDIIMPICEKTEAGRMFSHDVELETKIAP